MNMFLAKLLPMIRTIVSIPAGVLKLNLTKYIISSTLGIFLWNLVFVGAGYLLGDQVGVPISVERLAKGLQPLGHQVRDLVQQHAFEDAFHYREEAVAQKAITLYNKVAEEIKLHQTNDRKERALQWKENIMY